MKPNIKPLTIQIKKLTKAVANYRIIIEIWKSRDGWRWRMRRRGNQIVGESGEGYQRRASCIRSLMRLIASLRDDNYDIKLKQA